MDLTPSSHWFAAYLKGGGGGGGGEREGDGGGIRGGGGGGGGGEREMEEGKERNQASARDKAQHDVESHQ